MCKSAAMIVDAYELTVALEIESIMLLMQGKTMYLIMHKKCTASCDLCSYSSTNYYSNTRNRYQLHGQCMSNETHAQQALKTSL